VPVKFTLDRVVVVGGDEPFRNDAPQIMRVYLLRPVLEENWALLRTTKVVFSQIKKFATPHSVLKQNCLLKLIYLIHPKVAKEMGFGDNTVLCTALIVSQIVNCFYGSHCSIFYYCFTGF
jgi:FAD synthase